MSLTCNLQHYTHDSTKVPCFSYTVHLLKTYLRKFENQYGPELLFWQHFLIKNHKINIEFHHLTRKLYLWFADSPNSMLQDPIKDCILRIAVSVISQFGKLPVFPFLSWPWHFIKNTGYFVGYLSIWVCLVFFPVHQELQVVNMSQYWSFPQLS